MSHYAHQKDPIRSAVGIGFVVLLHVILILALLNGLGHRLIDRIAAPLQTVMTEPAKQKLPETPPPPPQPVPVQMVEPVVPVPQIPMAPPAGPNAITAVSHGAPQPAVPRPIPAPVVQPDREVSEIPLSHASPVYPDQLIEQDIEGSADVECDVDITGHTSNCRLDSATGSGLFGQSALSFARSNVYSPATRNGVPVTAHRRWHLNFKLTGPQ